MRKQLYLFLFISFVFQSSLSFAQADLKKLDKYFEKAQKDWGLPGMAVAIVKDGEVVLAKGYGNLESGRKAKADENSLFAIASNTKAFVATSLGILVEEGKLNWDDPVIKHLPYFELYDEYTTNHTTVRDLLCHRAGLGTFSGDLTWYKTNHSAEEVAKRIKFVPQAYGFRAGYGYSNMMFITAGEVIRKVSGKTWAEFAKEHIFKPLGMDRTVTSVNDLPATTNVASPHKPKEGKEAPIKWANWDNMGAAGGIISSVNDMSAWLKMHLAGGKVGGNTIVPKEVYANMWQVNNPQKVGNRSSELFGNRKFRGYGLGWDLYDYETKKVVTHSGGYDGMYSRVGMIPEENLGVVVLTNAMQGIGTYLMYSIFDAYLGVEGGKDWGKFGLENHIKNAEFKKNRIQKRIDARVENTKPSFGNDKYVGLYHTPMWGDVEVIEKNQKLYLSFQDAPQLNASLSHWHFDVFKLEWDNLHAWFDFGTAHFVMDNNGEIVKIVFDIPNDDFEFSEVTLLKK